MIRVTVTVENAQQMSELAAYIAKLEGTAQKPQAEAVKPAEPEPQAETAKPAEPEKDKAEWQPVASKAQIRTIMVKLTNAGKTSAVKDILKKYNAEKLSGVAESDYDALYADLEVLVNG